MVNQLEEKKKSGLKSKFRWFIQRQESSIILATVIYMAVVTCVNPVFISSGNLFNVLKTMGYTLITVVGMSFILITGGLDLSVGSVLALGGVITGMACKAGIPVVFAILLGMLTGVLIGFINGSIIVKAGIPPLIVTLGMQYVARGLVSVLTQGVPIYPLPEGLMKIDQLKILHIPMVVIVALAIAAIGHIALAHAPFGRAIYALGGNEEAARISGINTRRTKLMVYVITSTLAALAGIFMSARLGSAEAAAGTGYELTVICGAIIGGISTFGGMGSIIGATIGAFFMEVLTNSLTLMRISVYWQNLVVGVILVLAVLLDQYKRNIILKNSTKVKD
ncbi:ABC transporter permease [Hydrogenoanaerobacterium sp.]|uniref:ABC transporter permease n=1 Tax=Hydrogenoanaerobacterium sp. TaxID=2953763 RepID=UPI002898FCC3|nr:ABC transporter permease [Hydrogenoanaerobacterium sp.]